MGEKTKAIAGGGAKAKPVEQFKEKLPEGDCPPEAAKPLAKQIVLRLVPTEPACADDFKSMGGLGHECVPGHDPCVWCACSVFLESSDRQRFRDWLKYPKFQKMKFLAHVEIAENSGRGIVSTKSGHVSMWMYDAYDPVAAVKKYEPLQ